MAPALFISDLHLARERPGTTERFFAFLDTAAARASALYILGDLFEYWIGDDELTGAEGDPLAREVTAALRRLTGRGTALWLMHGNRDFLLGSGFCAATGAQLLDDPAVHTIEGVPTLFMHGDTLCTDDTDYQAWRRTARSQAWQAQFLAQPLAARRRTVLGMRERSQAVISEKPAEIMDAAADAVQAAFRTHGVRRLVHGHTHRCAHHRLEVDGVACERWVLPDWYGAGGYLAIDDAGPRLMGL